MQHWINKRKASVKKDSPRRGRWAGESFTLKRDDNAWVKALRQGQAQLLCISFAFLWALVPAAYAEQSIDLPQVRMEQVGSGSLLLRTPLQQGQHYLQAPKIQTQFEINVSGQIARTKVSQRFSNPTNDWVEATYVFPLPDTAAVDHLQLRVGERVIVGEIQAREQAKKTYERAKREGKRAALLSQERPNLFTTMVSNIAPGEFVDVEIQYQQFVGQVDEQYTLRLPLTMTPRYVPGVGTAEVEAGDDRIGSGWSAPTDQVTDAARVTPPIVVADESLNDHRVSLSMSIDMGRPLQAVASRYHPLLVARTPGSSVYQLSLADTSVLSDHDIELNWSLAKLEQPAVTLFADQVAGDDYLMLQILPPQGVASSIAPPRELILVVDTSGSMSGVSMRQAKASVQQALEQLRESDYFNVIEFNSRSRALFAQPMPADDVQLAQARDWVQKLNADGGTEMRAALEHALRGQKESPRLRQIIFITDGSVANEEGLFRLISEGLGASRLFTVGIGSAPNSWFMRKAAEIGRGTYTLISAVGEVEERMQSLFAKLQRPVLSDITIGWSAAGVTMYPQIVPDLYAGEPIIIAAKLPSAGAPIVSARLSGRQWQHTGAEDWSHSVQLDVAAATKHVGVSKLWARGQIAELADQRRRGADADHVRAEITAVALSHHLVSEATSLVAVDQTPVRAQEEKLVARNVASLLPHGQSAKAMIGMPATATLAPRARVSGLLLMLFALLVLLGSRVHSLRHAHAC